MRIETWEMKEGDIFDLHGYYRQGHIMKARMVSNPFEKKGKLYVSWTIKSKLLYGVAEFNEITNHWVLIWQAIGNEKTWGLFYEN